MNNSNLYAGAHAANGIVNKPEELSPELASDLAPIG